MFKNPNQQWAHQLAVYKASHGIDPKEKREQTLSNKLQLSISHEITRIATVTFMKPFIGVCIILSN